MTEKEMAALKPGDTVWHRSSLSAAIVHASYGGRVTAVRTYDLTNPAEWDHVGPDGSVLSSQG